MAVQRFRSEVDRTRRVLGAIFVALALFLIQWLVRVEIAARQVTVTALVYFALFGGLFYLGLRLLRPKDLFARRAGGWSRWPTRGVSPAVRSGGRFAAPISSTCPCTSGCATMPRHGYAMHSTLRLWASLRSVGLFLCVAVFVFARTSPSTFLAELREMDDLYRQVLLAGSGLVILILLVLIGQAVRDTFFPGTVRVIDRGVSYRWSRMVFLDIEELIGSHPIELIGDRRTLKLGETFCSPGATKAVAHELQRLIIEVAEANPHAR